MRNAAERHHGSWQMKTTKARCAVPTVAASALLCAAGTHGAQLAPAHGTVQSAEQPPNSAVAGFPTNFILEIARAVSAQESVK
jgi:hypothetical protein